MAKKSNKRKIMGVALIVIGALVAYLGISKLGSDFSSGLTTIFNLLFVPGSVAKDLTGFYLNLAEVIGGGILAIIGVFVLVT